MIPTREATDAISSWAVAEKEKEESRRVTEILLNGECEVIAMCREVDKLGCSYGIFVEGRANPVRKSKKLYTLLHQFDKLCSVHPNKSFYIEPLCTQEETQLRQRT